MLQEEFKGMTFSFDDGSQQALHTDTGLSVSFISEDARFGVSEMYFLLKWRTVEQRVTAGYETGLHKIIERFPNLESKETRKIKRKMSEVTLHLSLSQSAKFRFNEVTSFNMHKVFTMTLRYLIHKANLFPMKKNVNIDYFDFPLSESIFEELAARLERQAATNINSENLA